MSQLSTQNIAEHMMKTGNFYTAAILAAELHISSKLASAKLFNVRVSKKYTCETTPTPNRTVKVISIRGRSVSKNLLWDLVIFNKPIQKVVV